MSAFGMYRYDEMNAMNRNVRNTSIRDYNCGGYALNVFNWFAPYSTRRANYWNKIFGSWTGLLEENYETALEEMVNYMLRVFDGKLRLIEDVEEAAKGENVVAFRLASNDYHFMVRKQNKHWYHKMGGTEIQAIRTESVFSSYWLGGYNSRIVLFALKVLG